MHASSTPPAPISSSARTCSRCGRTKARSAFPRTFTVAGADTPATHDLCRQCLNRERAPGARPPHPPAPDGSRRCRLCHKAKRLHFFPRLDPAAGRGSARSRHCRVCHEWLRQNECPARDADSTVTRVRALRERRISLGIAIAHATCPPGKCRSTEELAAYAGVGVSTMRRLEEQALRKLHRRALELLASLEPQTRGEAV